MNNRILIVDDNKQICLSLSYLLEQNGYQTQEAYSPKDGIALASRQSFALIFMDMNFSQDTTSGTEGIELIRQLTNLVPDTPIVVMTAWARTDLVVDLMKRGAIDFIEKPWSNTRLLKIVDSQLTMASLRRKEQRQRQLSCDNESELLWDSPTLTRLMQQVLAVAETDATILLLGENGTGKSSLAQYIHKHSSRRHESFVSVNMGAISESLFESEMFGHKKGAFTDAKTSRIGRFQLAEKGTLFLDEIANTPLSQQSRLLRVLETGEFEVLGSSVTQQADIRLIAASNGDFSQLLQSGQFREDLYFRINTIEFCIPPLREREADIELLASHFLAKHCVKYAKPSMSLQLSAISALKRYAWPGNVRELSHVLERVTLLCNKDKLDADDLSLMHSASARQKSDPNIELMHINDAEQLLIQKAMEKTGGNAQQAAELLGISKSAMYRRIEKYAQNSE